MQKLKNNEAWPKFTGSYKKNRVIFFFFFFLFCHQKLIYNVYILEK